MTTNRLEAFSDGVMAIIITIMVLELKIPDEQTWVSLTPLIPKFSSYLFSFIYVGIYWNNHHHLFQTIEKVNGKILWANLHLLFWLSLLPFATAWLGEHSLNNRPPAFLYGCILLMCAISYALLEKFAIQYEGASSKIARAIKSNLKEKISILLYLSGILCSLIYPYLSLVLYYTVTILWLVPDRRIEKQHQP